jgi:hypothetical protein
MGWCGATRHEPNINCLRPDGGTVPAISNDPDALGERDEVRTALPEKLFGVVPTAHCRLLEAETALKPCPTVRSAGVVGA